MKKVSKNISNNLLRGSLLFGMLVAVLTMSTTSIQVSQFLSTEYAIEQADQDENTGDQEKLSSFEAITTSPQVSLEHQYLLIEVLPELIVEEHAFFTTDRQSTFGGKVLKILFRRIISPNAP